MLSKNGLSFLAVFSMALVSEVGHAEVENVNEVVVWGTEVSASSLKLDEQAITLRQADHMSDLLRVVPGVDVGGAHSLNQRITIRSMDDKDISISIDGANQNSYMYHHMGNLQIHADILKAVNVEVGNNSVVTGNLGGSVRFETKSANDLLKSGQKLGARLEASVANNGANRYSLTGYAQLTDSVDVLGYYNFVDRDNFKVGGGKILNSNGVELDGTDGKVRGLAGELSDALVKVGWNVSDNQRIKLGYESYTDEGDYSYRPDMGLPTDVAIASFLNIPLLYPTEFTRDTVTFNYQLDWSDHTTVKAAVFSNVSTLWRDERGLVEWRPPFATVNEGESKNTGYNVLATTTLNAVVNHNFTYGFDVVEYDTSYSSDGVELAGEESVNAAVFIQNRMDFESGLSVIPGLRYDNVNVESAVADDTYEQVSYALAVEYALNKNVLLSASTTELFKAPGLSEVFTGAGLGKFANYNINAISGLNTELAVAYERDAYSAGLTAFQTQLDSFSYEYASNPPYDSATSRDTWDDNVGDMTIDGFEAYLGYSVSNLDIIVSYSSASSELDAFDRYPELDGLRLDREQGDTFSASLDYDFEGYPVKFHLDVISVDSVDGAPALDSASVDNSKDSSTIANIALMWMPEGELQGLTMTFGVDNFFDAYYSSQSSRTGISNHPLFGALYLTDYEPGRNVKATVAYRF